MQKQKAKRNKARPLTGCIEILLYGSMLSLYGVAIVAIAMSLTISAINILYGLSLPANSRLAVIGLTLLILMRLAIAYLRSQNHDNA